MVLPRMIFIDHYVEFGFYLNFTESVVVDALQ